MSRVRSLAQPFGVGLITERVLVASRFGGSLVLALFLLRGWHDSPACCGEAHHTSGGGVSAASGRGGPDSQDLGWQDPF
jgi:hypothetical protein